MTRMSIAPRAARLGHGRSIASAAIALVVLIGCGVIGVASAVPGSGVRAHDSISAEGVGRLSPDAVHDGARISSRTTAPRVRHRLVDTGESGDRLAALRRLRSVAVDGATLGPTSALSASPTRGPPLTVV